MNENTPVATEKRAWTPPQVTTLPPLTELTLQTGPAFVGNSFSFTAVE